MEPGRIKELLEKYWQAETNEAEEAELKKYFNQDSESTDHPANPLFEYFRQEQQQSLSQHFDERLKNAFNTKKQPVRWLYPLLKVAAILLISFSVIYIFVPSRKSKPVASIETDTYKDPEQAYLETRKALLLISNHLNRGKNYIDEVGKLNRAEELIHTKEN